MAKENDVLLFCLPPHMTHALQHLDVSVFKSLKSHFSKALSFTKKDFVVSKREFARVVKTPFEQAFSISNIKSGFSKCGIYPFNPDAIDHSKIVQPFHQMNLTAARQVAVFLLPVSLRMNQSAV